MDYTLDAFCTDCRSILTSGCPLPQALSDIAGKLARLLANPDFVAATFDDDMPPGRRVLNHDPVTDVYVAPSGASRTATAPRGRSTATRAPRPT